MGRRNEQVTEFTVYEPAQRLDVGIVEGPVHVDGRWDFAAADGGGTHLTFTATGRLRFPLVLLQPHGRGGDEAQLQPLPRPPQAGA